MASGDTLYSTNAQGFSRPASSAATPDQRQHDSDGSLMNVWDFDPTTNERIEINFIMPQAYDNTNGIDVILQWSADGTATETVDVKWDVEWKQLRDNTDDVDTKGFSAEQTTTDPAATVNGQPQYTTISFTNAQAATIDAGTHALIRVTRDVADAADTMNSDDAQLWAVEIREQ